jgi:hypothetical protein
MKLNCLQQVLPLQLLRLLLLQTKINDLKKNARGKVP